MKLVEASADEKDHKSPSISTVIRLPATSPTAITPRSSGTGRASYSRALSVQPGVEIVSINLLPIPYQEEGDRGPEHKPSDVKRIMGGGYWWTARKQLVVSSKAIRRSVAHH